MLKYVAFMAAALAFAMSAQAQDDEPATVDPDHIASVLEDAGYPVEVVARESAYRQIASKSGTYQFTVEFFDCNAGKECDILLFYLGFRKTDEVTEEGVDAYSDEMANGRAFFDRRGNPVLEFELDLSDGFSDTEFTESLATWDVMVENFAGFLAGRPAPAPAAPAPATPPAEGAAPATS